MLSRTSLLFCNGLRNCHGRDLIQPLKRNLLDLKLQTIRSRDASRFSRRSAVKNEPSYLSQLKVPLIFTVATGSACILGHKHLGKLISSRSYDPSSTFNWWSSKPDWFKTYWLICGSCITVFASFRLAMLLSGQFPSLLRFMQKYFVNSGNPGSALESCVQMVLSSFCHVSPLHLGINMYIFYNVAEALVPEIGKDRFLGAYLFSGIVSGFTSKFYQVISGRFQGSVGASGAILGLLSLVIYLHPEYNFHIIFLPFLTMPGPAVFIGMATFDFLGCLRGWAFFDHAGHLGGLGSGILWQLLTSKSLPESYSIFNKKS
ncbi:Presenilins-associated rhomboid-like protein, mitochondrial [Frankliniella fusca]|uniref:rhomboid protease n=1 Tax=Frankliniella fusca TaxID=407009 RepID=A0AAE1H037_9NEOP|nr:Presenilins-associated rhomboid-like protein, mitochondrial [Frankliniella fusca]